MVSMFRTATTSKPKVTWVNSLVAPGAFPLGFVSPRVPDADHRDLPLRARSLYLHLQAERNLFSVQEAYRCHCWQVQRDNLLRKEPPCAGGMGKMSLKSPQRD